MSGTNGEWRAFEVMAEKKYTAETRMRDSRKKYAGGSVARFRDLFPVRNWETARVSCGQQQSKKIIRAKIGIGNRETGRHPLRSATTFTSKSNHRSVSHLNRSFPSLSLLPYFFVGNCKIGTTARSVERCLSAMLVWRVTST